MMRGLVLCAMALATAMGAAPARAQLVAYSVQNDGVEASLTGQPGDVARGRAIVANRQKSLCILCHTAPIPEQRFQGDIGPDLAGVGSRWSVAQLRLRVIDAQKLNAATVMPSYYRVEGLQRVARAQIDRPILDAPEIEDVVAWLASLRDPPTERK